jgi:hypothetical protein
VSFRNWCTRPRIKGLQDVFFFKWQQEASATGQSIWVLFERNTKLIISSFMQEMVQVGQFPLLNTFWKVFLVPTP